MLTTQQQFLDFLQLTAAELPSAVLVIGSSDGENALVRILRRLAPEKILETGFNNVVVVKKNEKYLGLAIAFGAALAADITHAFAAAGTKQFLHTGFCGALRPTLKTGHVFVPTALRDGTGIAPAYGQAASCSASLPDRAELLSAASGTLLTWINLFSENEQLVERWTKDGIAAVDLEAFAIHAAATAHHANTSSVLVVSENIGKKELLHEVYRASYDELLTVQDRVVQVFFAALGVSF